MNTIVFRSRHPDSYQEIEKYTSWGFKRNYFGSKRKKSYSVNETIQYHQGKIS